MISFFKTREVLKFGAKVYLARAQFTLDWIVRAAVSCSYKLARHFESNTKLGVALGSCCARTFVQKRPLHTRKRCFDWRATGRVNKAVIGRYVLDDQRVGKIM